MKCFYWCIAVFMIIDCCTFGGRHSPVQVQAEAIVISGVIGEKIDLDESDRYGLFTNIGDFVSAEFYDRPEPEKGYKIVLVTQYKPYVAYNNELLTLPMLRDYIEHYDSISISREGFEEKWQIVDYDTLGLPITQVEINKMVKSFFGNTRSCMGYGIVFGSCLGCLIGINSVEDDDNVSVDWTFQDGIIPKETYIGSFVGACIGAVAGAIAGQAIERHNCPKALLTIKEMRKPKEMK